MCEEQQVDEHINVTEFAKRDLIHASLASQTHFSFVWATHKKEK